MGLVLKKICIQIATMVILFHHRCFCKQRKSYMNTRFYYIKKKMRDYYSNVGKKKGVLSYEC